MVISHVFMLAYGEQPEHGLLANFEALSHFDQLYKLTTLGTICAGTCLVIFYSNQWW